MSIPVNLNGIDQLDLNFGGTTTASLTAPGVVTITNTPASGGSVTSVGLTVPSRQTVSGSPVTSSGTLAISDNTQTANEIFAGPSSGSASTPSFRALVPADLPVATTSALGAVKPDGSTITISGGVISGATSGITQLTGDVTAGPGSGSQSASVVKVNGASVPASHAYVGTNSSSQIISATTPLLPANNLSDVSSASTSRTNLGLGTIATQAASSVAITGGAINVGTLEENGYNVALLNSNATQLFVAPSSSLACFGCIRHASGDTDPILGVINETNTAWVTSINADGAIEFPDGSKQTTAATTPTLQTNGTNNTVQNKLNLVAGSNVTLTADGSGDVTIASSSSGTATIVDTFTGTGTYTSTTTYNWTASSSGLFRVTANCTVFSVGGTGVNLTLSVGYTNSVGSASQTIGGESFSPSDTGDVQGVTSFFVATSGSNVAFEFDLSASGTPVGSFYINKLVVEKLA